MEGLREGGGEGRWGGRGREGVFRLGGRRRSNLEMRGLILSLKHLSLLEDTVA